MNRLLAALKKNDQLSVEALRSLYRSLAVKCHPDAARGSEAEFVRLQQEYDQAVGWLLSRRVVAPARQASGPAPREQFLRALHLHAVRVGRTRRAHLPRLIELAFSYDHETGALMTDYRDLLLDELEGPVHQTFLHATHKVLLSAICTLAWMYETGLEQDRRMLMSYLDELSRRAGSLEPGPAAVVRGMRALLQREAGRPAISLVTIGTMETLRSVRDRRKSRG
ncbi:MAG TPA: hypothetical protein VMQ10_15035 [Spirochaetia bacterium]|nr:hypothetical protein [Spirochaetia bacterium]